jgi:hypothetical protein
MSTRYKGSILSSTAASSTTSIAYGIWKQSEVAQLINTAWPFNDIYWSSVSMLLCGEGTNGTQNNTFIDSSSNAFTVTRNGAATQGSVNPFGAIAPYTTIIDGGSGYFSGTSGYLTLADNVAFQCGTGSFTVEAWVNLSLVNSAQRRIWSYQAAGSSTVFLVGISTANKFIAELRDTTGLNDVIVSSTTTPSANTWYHVAFSRSGTTTYLFVNGALEVTTTGQNQNLGSGGTPSIGAFNATQDLWNGYISNFRFVKGTAVYTAAFTPPTAPLTAISGTSLLLGFTNAGIIDNAMQNNLVTVGTAQVSTSVFKFGTGSIAFSGTGAWLTSADNTSLQMGTGDFTIEGWVYVNAIGTAYGIVSKGAASTGWSVNITSGNKLQFSYTATVLTGTTSLAASTWYYFAVVRSGSGTGNLKIYLNGTADATSAGAVTDNFNQTSILYVGASRTGTTPLNGYIDELRITKGVARYTANFTAPQQAFPNQ